MKGLVFSEPMVKAWLAGNKTVTRRLMNPQPLPGCIMMEKEGRFYFGMKPDPAWVIEIKPPYRPGETVYIKETWCAIDLASGYALVNQTKSKDGVAIVYHSGCDDFTDSLVHKWFTPHFMPEWAARSHALIKSVRPERVQEITTRECVCEGMVCGSILDDNSEDVLREVRESKSCLVAAALLKTSGIPPRKQFIDLWETLHPGSWDRNEWCWVYTLKKLDNWWKESFRL